MATVIDNQEIAIATKINELADRFRLTPYDFRVRLVSTADNTTLFFYDGPPVHTHERRYFDKMLGTLGATQSGVLSAPDAKHIYLKVKKAIFMSPDLSRVP